MDNFDLVRSSGSQGFGKPIIQKTSQRLTLELLKNWNMACDLSEHCMGFSITHRHINHTLSKAGVNEQIRMLHAFGPQAVPRDAVHFLCIPLDQLLQLANSNGLKWLNLPENVGRFNHSQSTVEQRFMQQYLIHKSSKE